MPALFIRDDVAKMATNQPDATAGMLLSPRRTFCKHKTGGHEKRCSHGVFDPGHAQTLDMTCMTTLGLLSQVLMVYRS